VEEAGEMRVCGVYTGVYVFRASGLSDAAVGAVLLVMSLLTLCSSLVLVVKLLNSSLRGRVLAAVRRTVNAELPGRAAPLTAPAAMLVGAALTVVVQSSSVFTSVLTPLVGVGVLTLERIYPLTLGANMGTTVTGLLAALASPADRLPLALQVALSHLLFNVSGIALFYPLPRARLPVALAHLLGRTTARYRWFAGLYAAMMFFVAPLAVFALSLAGTRVLSVVVAVCLLLASLVVVVNVLQRSRPTWLPVVLRSWHFLPPCLRSLDPADRLVAALMAFCRRACCCCCCRREDGKSGGDGGQLTTDRRLLGDLADERQARDVCEIVITESDSCSERVAKEFALTLSRRLGPGADDVESGYGSAICTPAPSRLASYSQLPQLVPPTDLCTAAAAAPSRLPSYGRLELISETDAATTTTMTDCDSPLQQSHEDTS